MTPFVTIDEIHLIVRVPRDLPAAAHAQIVHDLQQSQFLPRLKRAVRSALRRYPSLKQARLTLAR